MSIRKTAVVGSAPEQHRVNEMLTLELFTPNDDLRPVYIAGNFNGWTVKDERFKMEKTSEGHYRFIFREPVSIGQPIEYKYVKGGWESEELDRKGHPPTNRRIETTRGKVNDVVHHWKCHENWYDSAFYPDIRIVAKRFNVPQLRRRRRISVLLPWNYDQTDRHYPVLYLQDGQNLFEPHAPFGTWGVDKQLAALAQHGKGDFIVVAIDHGGKERIREFAPYHSVRWGEGLGRDYARFLAETLKPYIDSNFRTLSDRQNTAIGGSSMGGLISVYAGFMFPQVFSKFMIFSPSLWVSNRIFTEKIDFSRLPATKIYLYAGGKEGSGMLYNAQRFQEAMTKRGYAADRLQFRLEIDPQGRHTEDRWGREFPKAAQWLFG
jgi:predicted alpha/beta superfamily hydrolase